MKNPIANSASYAAGFLVLATLSGNANAAEYRQDLGQMGPGIQLGRVNVHRNLVEKTITGYQPIYKYDQVFEQTPNGLVFKGYQVAQEQVWVQTLRGPEFRGCRPVILGYREVVTEKRLDTEVRSSWTPCAPNFLEQLFGCHERRQLQYIAPVPTCCQPAVNQQRTLPQGYPQGYPSQRQLMPFGNQQRVPTPAAPRAIPPGQTLQDTPQGGSEVLPTPPSELRPIPDPSMGPQGPRLGSPGQVPNSELTVPPEPRPDTRR